MVAQIVATLGRSTLRPECLAIISPAGAPVIWLDRCEPGSAAEDRARRAGRLELAGAGFKLHADNTITQEA